MALPLDMGEGSSSLWLHFAPYRKDPSQVSSQVPTQAAAEAKLQLPHQSHPPLLSSHFICSLCPMLPRGDKMERPLQHGRVTLMLPSPLCLFALSSPGQSREHAAAIWVG